MKPYELIAELMRREGLGALPLARKMNKTGLQPQIYRFSKGQVLNPERTTAVPLATYFDIPVEAIYDEGVATSVARTRGLLPANSNGRVASEAIADYNVVELAHSGAEVPLISWVKAGNWDSVYDPYQPGDASEWLPCPVRHGPRTIALRVSGDSMLNPGGRPSYSEDDIIFVDPDREPSPGDRCVVRLADSNMATFKQLVIEDGRRLLKALNPDWKPRYIELSEDAVMVGLVIGTWRPEA